MKSRIILTIIYGLLFFLAAFSGVVISFAAQPGGISQSNAFIAPFLGPWSQTLPPNPHPVSTWSAGYKSFAKSLTLILVLSLVVSYLPVDDLIRYISAGIAVPTLLVWVLAGLIKVLSQLA
jgi:hypothetical protein